MIAKVEILLYDVNGDFFFIHSETLNRAWDCIFNIQATLDANDDIHVSFTNSTSDACAPLMVMPFNYASILVADESYDGPLSDLTI